MRKRIIATLIAAMAVAAFSAAIADASCIQTTPAEQRARANVIFDGFALEGATPSGIQRFRVTRYLKGRGSAVLRVNTGNRRRADGTGSTTSVSLVVRRGERWRVFARGSVRKTLFSNLCDGSRKR
jgi:hypothetical protein